MNDNAGVTAVSSSVSFSQKKEPPQWVYFLLVPPLIICFLNLTVGFFLFVVFLIGMVVAIIEKRKLRLLSYTDVILSHDMISLSKDAEFKTINIHFDEIKKISFVNIYAANRFEMEIFKTGQELYLWDDKGQRLANFEYTDYYEGENLKRILLERLSLDPSNIIYVE